MRKEYILPTVVATIGMCANTYVIVHMDYHWTSIFSLVGFTIIAIIGGIHVSKKEYKKDEG
jgi:hypothetical protein